VGVIDGRYLCGGGSSGFTQRVHCDRARGGVGRHRARDIHWNVARTGRTLHHAADMAVGGAIHVVRLSRAHVVTITTPSAQPPGHRAFTTSCYFFTYNTVQSQHALFHASNVEGVGRDAQLVVVCVLRALWA